MYKKQTLQRSLVLSLLLASTMYGQTTFAANGIDGVDIIKDITLSQTGSDQNITIRGNDATKGDDMQAGDTHPFDGGRGGSTTVNAISNTDLTDNITINAQNGEGGDGGGALNGAIGGNGGDGNDVNVKLTVQGDSITHKNITLNAEGYYYGGNPGYGGGREDITPTDKITNADLNKSQGGNGGDAYLRIHVQAKNYTVDDITMVSQASSGGNGGSIHIEKTGDLNDYFAADTDLANSQIGYGGYGGNATAIGLLLDNSSGMVSSITAKDILITARGGSGGGSDGISSYMSGSLGGMGGAAEAYGIKVAAMLQQSIQIQANKIEITGEGRGAGSGDTSEITMIGKTAKGGGSGLTYGIYNQAYATNLELATHIKSIAQGGDGGKALSGMEAVGSQAGTGGRGGNATAIGIWNTNGITVSTPLLVAQATGGKGGQGGTAGTGGSHGQGGIGGNAYAYAVQTVGGIANIYADNIQSIAKGGVAGASSGAAGSSGLESRAYGVHATNGSIVNLYEKTLGNKITIGVDASDAQNNKAYSIYADSATVLFHNDAVINHDTTTTDYDVITYLNNSTFGFAGTDAGRTITGGMLSLQGSNTLIINTDLANNKADKITFYWLDINNSTATQYITVGYDPAIDPANLGSVDLSSNLEIFEIANLEPGQNLDNFQAKANILDSALYKFTVTPEIGVDASGNKLEISGITTAKLALPSESVMTAADTMTGMGGIWRTEGNNLMKRMGDLRSDPEAAKGGVWARYYRGDQNALSSYGRSLNQDYTAFQGGIDKVQPYHSGRLYTGIAVNHIDANSSYSMGRGEGSSTGVGLYTSWIGDKGHYVDVILRASRLSSNFKLTDTSGNHINADYSTWAYGLSAEYGYRHKMQAGWFVEPQAELSFGHINGVSYTMSNGAKMDNSAINSLTARLGFVLGKEFKTAQRPGNVYLKGSLYHEFGGKGSLTGYYNNDYIHADGSPNMGTWYELGIGTNLGIAKNSNLYIDALKTFGGKINTKWQLNAGVRVNF